MLADPKEVLIMTVIQPVRTPTEINFVLFIIVTSFTHLNPPEVQTQPHSGVIAPPELRKHLVSFVEGVAYLNRMVST